MKTKLFALVLCFATGFTMFVTPTRAAGMADTLIRKEDAAALGQTLTLLRTTLNQISNKLNARDGMILARSGEINSNLASIHGNLVSINSTLIALSGDGFNKPLGRELGAERFTTSGGGQFIQKSLPQGNPAVQPLEKNATEPVTRNVNLNALLSESAPVLEAIPNESGVAGQAGQAALASNSFDFDANKIIWPSILIILIFAFALWLRKRDKEDATKFASLKKSIREVSTALIVEDVVAKEDLHRPPVAQTANVSQPHITHNDYVWGQNSNVAT